MLALVPLVAYPADSQKITLANPRPEGPISLDVSSPGGAEFVLQRSSDLKTWLPLVTVYSRVAQFRVVDHRRSLPDARTTFVTASAAVQTPEQMLAAWRSHGFTAYRFKFQRMCFCFPIDLSADVTVRDGKVVAAENMSDGRGTPGFTAPLDRFKSIEELYAMTAELRGGAAVVQIGMADGLPFPTWIDVDHTQEGVDDEIIYRISDVVRIE